MMAVMNNLTIEMALVEEEVVEGLEAALVMDMDKVGGNNGEGEEGGEIT